MTQSLLNVAVQQFRDQWVLEYAAKRALEGTVVSVRGVVGDAYKWPLLGNAIMIDRGAAQSLIPASDVSHTQITTTFTDKVLNLPTDIFQQAAVNVSERAMLARRHAEAIQRFEDQLTIDALNASATTNTIAAGGVNLTVDKLTEASEFLNEQNVPMENRFIVIGSKQLTSLLDETEVTSSDFNTVKALVRGELDTFVGFKFITIGARAEGGLPIAASVRTVFAWHMTAMGQAYRLNPNINAEWSVERQSWLTVSRVSAGASAILDEGIVKIDCLES